MTRSLHTFIYYLRQRIPRCGEAALTDAQLLERWSDRRDPAAFELLLWRHGPMVLNTCRRLLPRREDVEDAFQATFLVLVRKAGSIRRREALAAWLHRVACRIAGRARDADGRRASREQPLAAEPSAPPVYVSALSDLHAILDEEIECLPARYRRALILCCLEGRSQEEAARLLRCPRGTVSSWLTRGRERLRQRLLRRGIVVSTGGLAAALTPDSLVAGGMISRIGLLMRLAGGAVPHDLLSARSIALAEGVLRMMFMTKVKIVAVFSLVVVLMATGAGTWSHTTRAEDPEALKKATDDAWQMTQQLRWQQNFKRLQDEQKQNDIGRREISPQDAKAYDGIAWGEKAHGLQAGIGFRRGDQTTYEVGQSVTFVVYLRNVSDKTIHLSHSEPLFDESMPVVRDAQGRHLAVASGHIDLGVVPIVQRSVEGGQRITLGHPWFRVRPSGWRGDVLGPTCCAEPGGYKVGYTSLPLRLNDGPDISLGTKPVELSILKPKAGREEPVRPPTREPAARGERNAASLPQLFYVNACKLSIPVRAADRDRTASLIMLVSNNLGESYQGDSWIAGDDKQFTFHAPRDGTYWFIVQEEDKDGHRHPANPHRAKPSTRICVDTMPPVVTLGGWCEQNTVQLAWTATDANLEEKPVRGIEWSDKKNGPWSPRIISGPLPNNSSFQWKLPDNMPDDFYVRIQVRDKAGNDAYAVVYLKKDK